MFSDAAAIKPLCTWAGVEPGCASRYSAAEPVTCGDDMDVPEIVLVAVFEVFQDDVIFTP